MKKKNSKSQVKCTLLHFTAWFAGVKMMMMRVVVAAVELEYHQTKKTFVDAAANLPQGIGGLRSWDLPFISSSHHQTKKEGEEVSKKSYWGYGMQYKYVGR